VRISFKALVIKPSVETYQASGYERGAVLDYLDYPLNNRWWVEDQFVEIRLLESEDEKIARLDIIRKWENPGPGSFYDDIGNVGSIGTCAAGKTLCGRSAHENQSKSGFYVVGKSNVPRTAILDQ
jgi:hypothetical protein